MDENQKSTLGELEKLALLSDYVADIFPKGNAVVVFELNKDDYKKMFSNFRQIDHHHNQFTIEISGVDFHFMLHEEKS